VSVSKSRIGGDPIFFPSWGILGGQSVTSREGQNIYRANLLARPRWFGFLLVSQPMHLSTPCWL